MHLGKQMNLKRYQNTLKLLGAITCGSFVSYYTMKLFERHISVQQTKANMLGSLTDHISCGGSATSGGSWIHDWDNREQQGEEIGKPIAVRHIVLVRHGEYVDSADGSQHLTQRGRIQAKLIGQRLQAMGVTWDHVVASTMTRAQETAMIIMKEINFDPLKMKRCELLPEGTPYMSDPQQNRNKMTIQRSLERDAPRIEAAFRRYFFRASPEQRQNSHLLIIGHANVFRYLICRALQLPPEAWTRISLNHCSITWLTIWPSGYVTINLMGETGFMPVDLLTSRKPTTCTNLSSS